MNRNRRLARRHDRNLRRRKSFLQGGNLTRKLRAEQLESRALLAAIHNYADAFDTDRDDVFTPADILHVINEINRDDSGADQAQGEDAPTSGDGSADYNNDVNNDGYVSPHDALTAINEYNRRGEGEHSAPQVRFRVRAVPVGTPVSGNDISTPIVKGTDFDLLFTAQDIRPNSGADPHRARGVYAAYLDVLYNKGLANVEIEEIQKIVFNNGPTGGNFTLTFNGQTTGNIRYDLDTLPSNPELTIAANIKSALQGLSTIGTGNVEVHPVTGDATTYYVRFQGARGDTDQPLMTANPSGLTPSGQTITITEDIKGVYSAVDADGNKAFERAFRFNPFYAIRQNAFDGQLVATAGEPTVDPNRINNAGAIAGGTAFPPASQATAVREVFRVRMNSIDAGILSFLGNVSEVDRPDDDTLLYGTGEKMNDNLDNFDIVNSTPITITEPFSAIADTFTFSEDPGTQTLTVMANDVNAGTSSGVTIQSINSTGFSLGSLSRIGPANRTISFVPTANANGTSTFTYTLVNSSGVRDTATVTVTLNAVNDAPVNAVPGAQTANEDTAKVINGISISDVDADEQGPADVQVTLTVNSGAINLASVNNLNFIGAGGNGASTMTFQGRISDINTALNGLTYTPVQDFNGVDTFRIVTDDLGHTGSPGNRTDTDTVSITVSAVNDAPIVFVPAATQTTTETIDLVFNAANSNEIRVADVDVNEAGSTVVGADKNRIKVTLNVAGSGANTPGTLSLGSTTGITFLAGANNTGSMSIRGTLADVNAALNNLTFRTVVGAAGNQTLTVAADDLGNSGAGGPLTDTEVVNISVIPLVRPYAFPDSETVAEDSTDNPIDVLDNDLEDQGSTKDLLTVSDPPRGTATISGEMVLYTPDANFWGSDTFTYTMNENPNPGGTPDSTGTVTVTITNVPDAPVATGESTNVNEDTSVDVAVLSNDTDADNINNAGFTSTLTPVIVSGPSHGTASVLANGRIRYNAGAGAGNANYNGPDSLTYKVRDESGRDSAVVTLAITVDPVNDAPVAVADSYTTAGNRPIEDTLFAPATGVRNNDSDVEDAQAALVVSLVSGPSSAAVFNLNADGSFTYQANQDFDGADSFVYRLTDTGGATATATVTLDIEAVNDAPVATPDSYSVEEDTLLNANNTTAGHPRATVRANDSDVDNTLASLTVSLVSSPANASTFNLNADGSFTYQATENYNGPDSFVYRLTDPSGATSTATVSINVTERNDPPVAVNDSYTATEDVLLSKNTAEGVRDNTAGRDSDPDNTNAQLQVQLVSGPSHAASFTLNSDGSFSYQPAANYNGPDSFRYKLIDTFAAESNTATVSITVAEVNDPPTAVDDGVPTRLTMIKNFDNQVIRVLLNDSDDPDFNVTETLTVIGVATTGAGPFSTTATTQLGNTVRISNDGTHVLFDENTGIEADDQFSYKISDGRTGEAIATVFVKVVNFIPTDVSGTIFMDTNNDGTIGSSEKRLAGVKVNLVGHDNIFNIDYGVDTDNNPSNNQPALEAFTDINGFYQFDDVRPGNYTLIQNQPSFLRDGQDRAGTIGSVTANDQISFTLQLLGVNNGSQPSLNENNNFAERGLDAQYVSYQDILASSTGNGLILSVDGQDQNWQMALAGWANLKSCSCVLNGDNTATFTFTDNANNVYTRTVAQTGNPRFRIMGYDGTGNALIRLDGSAADFGLTLAAAGNGPQGEGEGEAPEGAEYARGVDAIMTDVGMA